MKIFISTFGLFMTVHLVYADSILASSEAPAAMLTNLIEAYSYSHGREIPRSWDELASMGPRLNEETSPLVAGRGMSEVYSFISPGQRQLYPEGELIAIGYAPMDWPSEWSSSPSTIDITKLTTEQIQALFTKYGIKTDPSTPEFRQKVEEYRQKMQAEAEASKTRQKPIRFLIYRDKNGKMASKWLEEGEVQAMLTATGIIVPPPVPFHPEWAVKASVPATPRSSGRVTNPATGHNAASDTQVFAPYWELALGLIALLFTLIGGRKLATRSQRN